MDKKGQFQDPIELIKLAVVIFVAFFLFSILATMLNSIGNLEASIDSIINAFIPLIILAIFFELIRRIFG